MEILTVYNQNHSQIINILCDVLENESNKAVFKYFINGKLTKDWNDFDKFTARIVITTIESYCKENSLILWSY